MSAGVARQDTGTAGRVENCQVGVRERPPSPRRPLKCANLAPMTVAAAADSRPTRQVIFLTRRRPSSRASAALDY